MPASSKTVCLLSWFTLHVLFGFCCGILQRHSDWVFLYTVNGPGYKL